MGILYCRNQLIGAWFGEHYDKQGNKLTEFARFEKDGRFEFMFVQHNKVGEVLAETTEQGDWGLVSDIHFTLTKSEWIDNQHVKADMTNADNYQAYKILELTHHAVKYQHIITEEVFNLKRVVDKIAHC